MNALIEKEKRSIQFIRNANDLALQMNNDGFHVAFSGGKDSQVLYHLMEASGCKFKAHMQITTVDPPQLMKFIRSSYKNVSLHLPKENMSKLIERKGILPMRDVRYCCQEYKEFAGAGTCTCIGIRKYESNQRAKRNSIEISGNKGINYEIEGGKLIQRKVQFDLFEVSSETIITCVKGSDKIIISPIFQWTNRDVWSFLKENNIPTCELYRLGFHRIGCMFCPMASKKEKRLELKLFGNFAEKIYIKSIRTLMNQGKYQEFRSAEDVFMWWISNTNRDEWLLSQKYKKADLFNENAQ
jgi:phosphoadenosine phosphosulfate reductase